MQLVIFIKHILIYYLIIITLLKMALHNSIREQRKLVAEDQYQVLHSMEWDKGTDAVRSITMVYD
jgi:hypothetical protein